MQDVKWANGPIRPFVGDKVTDESSFSQTARREPKTAHGCGPIGPNCIIIYKYTSEHIQTDRAHVGPWPVAGHDGDWVNRNIPKRKLPPSEPYGHMGAILLVTTLLKVFCLSFVAGGNIGGPQPGPNTRNVQCSETLHILDELICVPR